MPQQSPQGPNEPQRRIGPLTKEEAMRQAVRKGSERGVLELLRERRPEGENTPDTPSGPPQP